MLLNISNQAVLDSLGAPESVIKGSVTGYFFYVFDSLLPFRFSRLLLSAAVGTGRGCWQSRAHPLWPVNLGPDVFTCDFLGLLWKRDASPALIFLPFLFWEWSNLTWFPLWKSRRGGSALCCNIDEQCLVTIITAALSSMVWTCDTSVCFSTPFKNKGFNFIFVFSHLYFILVFDVKCMLSCPSLTVVW